MTDTHATPPGHDGADEEQRFPRRRPPVGAVVLLGIAALLVFHQFGLSFTGRWWTVFILVPAAGVLVAAARFYRAAAGWTPPAIGAAIGGTLLMGLWARLFFGPGWHGPLVGGHFFAGHFIAPVILVILAIALLRRRRWRH